MIKWFKVAGPETGVPVSAANPLPTTSGSGANVDLGAKADAAASSDTGTFSLIALFKRLLSRLHLAAPTMATTQVTLVATTSTNILAARATRRFARVRVDSNAAVGVYVTEATPASAINGLFIPPGASEDIPYTGILYAYSAGTPLLYIRDVYD